MKRALLLAATLVATLLTFSATASAACVAPYCPAPSAATGQASNITDTSAVLNGAVNPNGGGATTYYFTNADFTQTYGSGTLADSTSASSVSMTLVGLQPSTTYSYRIMAKNGGGPAYGSVITFTTLATAPSGGGGGGASGTGGSGVPSTSPKVNPNEVSISAKPRRDRRAPFRYTVSGGVEVSDGSLCGSGGTVTIRFSRDGRTVASRDVDLEADCGYQATVAVPRRNLPDGSHRINVKALFAINDALNPAASDVIKVRYR